MVKPKKRSSKPNGKASNYLTPSERQLREQRRAVRVERDLARTLTQLRRTMERRDEQLIFLFLDAARRIGVKRAHQALDQAFAGLGDVEGTIVPDVLQGIEETAGASARVNE